MLLNIKALLLLGGAFGLVAAAAGGKKGPVKDFSEKLFSYVPSDAPHPYTVGAVQGQLYAFAYSDPTMRPADTKTALDFVGACASGGYSVFANLSLLGTAHDAISLLIMHQSLVTPAVTEGGTGWTLLASPSDAAWIAGELSRLRAAPKGGEAQRPVSAPSFVPGGGYGGGGVPIFVPGQGSPMQTPATPTAPSVLPTATPTSPIIPTSTGIPEIDELLQRDDVSVARLRAVATQLAGAGNPQAAAIVGARATALYARQRAAAIAAGGSPFAVRYGLLPYNVAQHYNGTLSQLSGANPGKSFDRDWIVGSTWLAPLAWDAEAKEPPTPLSAPKSAPTGPIPPNPSQAQIDTAANLAEVAKLAADAAAADPNDLILRAAANAAANAAEAAQKGL